MAAIFAEAQVPYAKIMGCAKLVTVPREFSAWLGRAQGAKPVFKSVSGLSGPNFWPDVPVQASCLTRRIVHHVGGLSKLAGCRTRPFGLGRIPAPLHEIRQRPVSSWSPGAHGRGRPWHPLGSDPRSLCARLEVFRASCQIGRAVRSETAPSTGFLLPLFNRTFFCSRTALHDAFTLEHCFRKACTAAQHA